MAKPERGNCAACAEEDELIRCPRCEDLLCDKCAPGGVGVLCLGCEEAMDEAGELD